MRILTWAIRLALFILLLAFAAKNTDPVTLRFFFDSAWQAPLVLLLLGFFVAGAFLGLTAAVALLLRQRRELQRLRQLVGLEPAQNERGQGRGDAAAPVPPRPAEG
ncbi:MAG: lipopolysaccharide assembly protein LapA domain-containing protein [Proteobacteria bacterium]|nr:lipopolysaccharide assembly protein LapA domain-containing protein [Pseudomonadota bacterium]MDA0983552.1 lipopolysaccharide assembly protein LapA domain-containing protein [Pseudomonadota bacterium]